MDNTSSVSEWSADPEEYTAYKAGRALYVYLSPCLLVLGLAGNTLSFLVLSKRSSERQPTYLYLTVLAVVDVLALYLPCVRGWLKYMIDVDLMVLAGCSWYFILYFSVCNISVYIVVCVTVDRLLHTFFPISARSWCTRRKAILCLAMISFLVSVINLHYPWTMKRIVIESDPDNSTPSGYACVNAPGYDRWMSNIWPYLDLTIYSFLPFVILMTCNSMIIYRLAAQSRKIKQSRKRSSGVSIRQDSDRQGSGYSRTTVMLVGLSFMLLITTSPIVTLHIVETYWHRSDPEQVALHFLATAICEHLMYLNNCFNFILYFLRGSKFREELTKVLCKRPNRRVWPSSATVAVIQLE